MTDRAMLLLLTGGRIAVGGGTLVAPRAAARLFGVDPHDNPALPYVGRLFGGRAVFMALLLLGSRGAERTRQLRAGVVVDVVDALAALAAGRRAELGRGAAAAAFGAAAFEAGLGLRLLSAGGGTAQQRR
jgi:hypothetical protein